MSQKELADRVGVREKDISRWENGRNLPRDHAIIIRLAAAVKQTTDYLLGANGPRTQQRPPTARQGR